MQCATIYAEKLKEAHDSGVQYENAAKAFKNVNTKEALRCYNQAVDILVSSHEDGQADARACGMQLILPSCFRGRRGGRSMHATAGLSCSSEQSLEASWRVPARRVPIRILSIDRCCSLLPPSHLGLLLLRCSLCRSQMENNKFAMAAKIWKEMGMLHEKEHNAVGAMSCFQKAADWCAHGGHTNDGGLSLLGG